jgi:endonuclease/exonuclease/phosphatase (EEP) superfamily protein YafD
VTTIEVPAAVREPAEEPSRRRWSWPTRLAVAAVALWALWVIVQRAASGRFWLLLLPDLIPPIAYLAVPAILAVSLLWARPVRFWIAGVLLVTLVVQLPRSGLNWHALAGQPAAPAAGRISVFSWNTEYWHQTDPAGRFYDYLKAQHADIYLLQEYELADASSVTGVVSPDDLAALRTAFPGYQVVSRGELVTLSRFPVLASPGVAPDPGPAPGQDWDLLAIVTKTLRVDVRTPGGVLSTYNVHLPVQLNQASPLSAEFYRNVRHADDRRQEALRGLRADVAANPNPLLIAGDFNTTAAMGDLRRLDGVVRDATDRHGSFYPYSWDVHTPLRLWRLDWLFTAGRVQPYDYGFQDVQGMSDHRAQHVVVVLR